MSYFVWGVDSSYRDYLQEKVFHEESISRLNGIKDEINTQFSSHTKDIIASNEAIAQENFRFIDASTSKIVNTLRNGFDQLSNNLQEISVGISQLNATFHWGFNNLIAELGHMKDGLKDLLKIAKSPAQAAAFEQFEIARDAFRQKLYPEALESLDRAINGDHTSPGYKLEWRFYKLAGIIQLGFSDCDLSLIDTVKAENSFLLAARYARTDFPQEAGNAFLSAGWAAYTQGNFDNAIKHTEQAIEFCPNLCEAFFLSSKISFAQAETEKALGFYRKAIEKDRRYILKGADDGDFQRYESFLFKFYEELIQEKYRFIYPKVHALRQKLDFFIKHSKKHSKIDEKINILEVLSDRSVRLPLLDLLQKIDKFNLIESKIQSLSDKRLMQFVHLNNIELEHNQLIEEEETYFEEIVIRPKKFFRKAVKKFEPKTRVKTKRGIIKQKTVGWKCNIFSGGGKLIIEIQFIKISPGVYWLGTDETKVVIKKGFYIIANPITTNFWNSVMVRKYKKGSADRPVENVSVQDRKEFVNKINTYLNLTKAGSLLTLSFDNVYGGSKPYFRLPKGEEAQYARCCGPNNLYIILCGFDTKLP